LQNANHLQASFANPTQIFADDVVEEKGENARLSAFVGAIAVGDLVKSTLGPKGMDKILQSAYVGWSPENAGFVCK
jgi:T-complex protein 1 subunit beta